MDVVSGHLNNNRERIAERFSDANFEIGSTNAEFYETNLAGSAYVSRVNYQLADKYFRADWGGTGNRTPKILHVIDKTRH